MSLKVGDKVKLNPESEHATNHVNNPLDTLGEVAEADRPSSDYPLQVEWSNGVGNVYREHDLILQEEVKEVMTTNKIGELITNWSELEVGDKAVFEGYATSSNAWSYTIGKTYTVLFDEDDDKGFIEDDSRSCPDYGFDRFKFRLVSKVQQYFPSFSFKLRNGDKPEVRQWLKDSGVVWTSGQDISGQEDQLYIFVNGVSASNCDNDLPYFTKHALPEIQLNIQPAVVIGYELVEVVDKTSEKELQLESLVAKLSSQLEEAQTELNKIK